MCLSNLWIGKQHLFGAVDFHTTLRMFSSVCLFLYLRAGTSASIGWQHIFCEFAQCVGIGSTNFLTGTREAHKRATIVLTKHKGMNPLFF